MPVFAENVSIQRTYADGKHLGGFQKAAGRKAKFFAIPDIRELFLVSPTRENLAGRLQSLLRRHTQKHKKRRRHHRQWRRKRTRLPRRRRGRHRTRRKGKRTRKK